jgi:hypothetical protein
MVKTISDANYDGVGVYDEPCDVTDTTADNEPHTAIPGWPMTVSQWAVRNNTSGLFDWRAGDLA